MTAFDTHLGVFLGVIFSSPLYLSFQMSDRRRNDGVFCKSLGNSRTTFLFNYKIKLINQAQSIFSLMIVIVIFCKISRLNKGLYLNDLLSFHRWCSNQAIGITQIHLWHKNELSNQVFVLFLSDYRLITCKHAKYMIYIMKIQSISIEYYSQ